MSNPLIPYDGVERHPQFPHLPAQAGNNIKPDNGCSGCPLSGVHKTCQSFQLKNDPVVPDTSRISLTRLKMLQNAVSRKAFDANGIIGSESNNYYRYNADYDKSINWTDFVSFKIVSASGNILTLERLDSGQDTRVKTLRNYWIRETILNYYWITGAYELTAIQAGDMVAFPYPSAANNKLTAKIHKIISCTDTTIVLELDKAVDICNTVFLFDPENETAPDHLTAKVYSYSIPEDFKHISNPRYFYGKRKQIVINALDLPSNGIYIIDNKDIATPTSADPLTPNFVCEAFNGTNWITINQNDRLFIKNDLSCYAFGTTNPTGSIRQNPTSTLLSSGYTQFRLTYYEKTNPEDDFACVITGYDRCINSLEDASKSVGNYGTTYGVGVDGDNHHHYCSKRIFTEFKYEDNYNRFPPYTGTDGIPDTLIGTEFSPEYIEQYPTDGACVAFGYCSLFKETTNYIGGGVFGVEQAYQKDIGSSNRVPAPFNMDYAGAYLRDIVFAADCKKQQLAVLMPDNSDKLQRVKHSSLMYLNGYYKSLSTPDGWHPKQSWIGHGSWAFPLSVAAENEDEIGNTYLLPASGYECQYHSRIWDVAGYNINTDAFFPANVTGYKTKRNIIDYNTTTTDNLLTTLGTVIERDTGILKGRGLIHSSQAIPAQDIICPNINLNDYNNQDRAMANFKRNLDGSGVLQIKPLRQTMKDAVQIAGSRQIHSVENAGNNIWKIEFENQYQTYSKLDLGDLETIGDSYDKLYQVAVSGGDCFGNFEWQRVDSYHAENKTTGARSASAWIGDCITLPSGESFMITSIAPSAGSSASTYGQKKIVINGATDGFATTNVPDPDNQYPLQITSVINNSDSITLTVKTTEDDEIEKPDLAENECWFDGVNRVYFSSLNHNDTMTINVKGANDDTFYYYFTVDKNKILTTTIDWADWVTADVKKIYIGNQLMTVTVGGTDPVEKNNVRINSNINNKIIITYNIDNASNDNHIKLILDFNEPADTPDDWWNVVGQGFLSGYALKRDVVWVYDDSNYFANNNVLGDDVTFWQSKTCFIPKASYQLQYTGYQSDNWIDINPIHYVVNAANGTIDLNKDFLNQSSIYGYGYGYGYESTDNNDFFDVFGIEKEGDYGYGYGYGYGIPKPNDNNAVCLKIKDISLMSHLSPFNADLLNKIEGMNDAQQWCFTSMGVGYGDFSFSQRATHSWAYYQNVYNDDTGQLDCLAQWVDEGIIVDPPDTNKHDNGFYIYQEALNATNCYAIASISYSASTFGLPELIKNLPDGCEILEAQAEVSSSGLTIQNRYGENGQKDCNGNVITESSYEENTIIQNLNYSLIGFTSKTTFETVGTISTNATDKRQVISITDIIKKMYEDRNTTKYGYGYGLIFSPIEMSNEGTGIEKYLPAEGAKRPRIWCTPQDPNACPRAEEEYYTYFSRSVDWDNLTFGNIAIKIKYPDNYFIDNPMVNPRLPSLSNNINKLPLPS